MAIGNLRRLGWAAVAALAAGCSGVPSVATADDPSVRSIAQLLRGEFDARATPVPRTPEQVEWWNGADCVVLVTDDAEPLVFDAATRRAVLDWVRGGGALVGFGFGARLAHDLGVESEAPSRVELVRWGDDERTAIGLLQYGFTVEGDHDELCRELRAFPREPGSFLIGGGERVALQVCEWRERPPKDGEVLGVLCELRDLEFAPRGGAVLVRWQVGDGVILGCGCVPEPWREAPAIAANARQFVRNAVTALSRGAAGPTVRASVAVRAPERAAEAHDFVLARLSERAIPGALVVPHWGWQVATNFLRDDRRPISPRQVFDEVLVPSFRAGATLVDLQLADSRDGYPFAWVAGDPIARPASFHGGGFWPGWTREQIALLAREAHHRGMWLQCWLEPPPVHVASATERDYLDAAKWWAREFADVRASSGGAIDGLGVHRWFDDAVGASGSVLRAFQPAMHLYETAAVPSVDGFAGTVDADRGRPAGVPVAGVSAQWRDVSEPEPFPNAVLDCRERRPSSGTWGVDADRGGGSYADWLVTQLGDFARRRAFGGAALWWRAHNPATLGEHTVDYVHGLSLDPLRAAVAGRLTATGTGGYRDLCRQLIERAQSGFGAESSLPAAMPFLQNNHFRLHGSGGPLWVDRSATACFRESDERTIAVSPQFMTTHVRGFRPSVASVHSAVLDFIGARPRGEGGYDTVTRVDCDARGGDDFPAVLAREEQPSWPARLEAEFQLTRGRYELDLVVTARADRGIVEVSVDGEVLALRAFEVGRGTEHHSVLVDLARDGAHRLALDVVHGGAVGITQCRLTRVEDRAGQARVVERAGHCAELAEESSSTYFSESASLRTIADFGGFVWEAECSGAARNAQVVRRFALPLHTSLGTAAEPPDRLRSSFVLTSADDRVPDLAIVPLDLPPQARFEFVPGRGLEFVSYPRPHQRCRVGFVFLRDFAARDLDAIRSVCAEIADPHEVRLDVGESVTLEPSLGVAWPRLVRVFHSERVPLFVRENGAWLFRGTQPTSAGDGSRWLRVYHCPGQAVEIAAWDAERTPVRPAPGSAHSVALREVTPHRVEVEVLQTGPSLAAPAVEFLAPFDRVTVDGEPWSYFDQRRVCLPTERGRYVVETRVLGHDPQPQLLATRAVVRRCQFDADHGVLEFLAAKRPEDPDDVVYSAWISVDGGFDVSGEHAVRVPDETFGYDDVAGQHVKRRGSIIRFAPGLVRVRLR